MCRSILRDMLPIADAANRDVQTLPDDEALNPDRSPTVFLSYASADREAARVLKDALPAFGLEVWYDESELGGGELWDQKIRKQIRDCDYFMPLISAQTEARHEGYFRREWRLAVERTLDMADDHPFLLPVAIDNTNQEGARVPEKFFAIQWLRVPGGKPTAALEALCRRLVSGESSTPKPAAGPLARGGKRKRGEGKAPAQYPVMPVQGTGSKTQYWLHLFVWGCRSVWVFFNQLPRWVRTLVYIWLAIVLLSRSCSNDHESRRVAPADAEKLNALSDKYHGNLDKKDISKLAAQIARITSDESDEAPTQRSPLLATPFSAPPGDAEAAKLADSTFALVYGKLVIAHHGRVGLSAVSESCDDLKSAVERGRTNHSAYILCGSIGPGAPAAQVLTIKMAKVSDGTILWSKAYPIAGADAAKIAQEVDSKVPPLQDD
jgi:TolB-like protein